MSAVLQRPPSPAAPRRALGMVVAFLALLSGLAIGAPGASAAPSRPQAIAPRSLVNPTGPPFGCQDEGLLFQAPAEQLNGGFINRINLVSGETVQSTPIGISVNSVGYNTLDGYVYGTANNFDSNLDGVRDPPDERVGGTVRVHNDGTEEYLGMPDGWPAGVQQRFVIGDISINGQYVFGTAGAFNPPNPQPNAHFYVVDMDPTSPTYFDLVRDMEIPAPAGFSSNPDWAFFGQTLYQLWFEGEVGVPGPMHLFSFRPLTANPANIAYEDVMGGQPLMLNGAPWVNSGLGALYADRINNYLYASDNADGMIYRINVVTGEVVQFAQGAPSQSNDGARCANAPLNVDFGDAPASYGTNAAANGPRHSLVTGLALGATTDRDADGLPTVDASGDDATTSDDEDAFGPGALSLNANAPAVTVPITNTTGGPVTVAGWIDLNGNGNFLDAGERQMILVPAGTPSVNLGWGAANSASQNTFARFRIYKGTVADPQPLGAASDGEVEDYPVTLAGSYVVSKSATVVSESSQALGTQITYTIAVTNQSSVPVPGGSFVDPLGNVLDDATMIVAPTTSDGSPVSFDGATLSWNGTVPVGGLTVNYTVQINNTLNDGLLWNWVEGPGCVGQATAPPCGHRVLTGTSSVSKTADVPSGSSVGPGQQINYTITVAQQGAAAVNASFTDDIGGVLDDATLVQPLPAGLALNGTVLSWSGVLEPRGSVSFTYGVVVNSTLGDGDLPNAVVGPNCPPGTTAPPCGWDLKAGTYSATKTATVPFGSSVRAGDVIGYTITVSQSGQAAVNASFTDDLNGVLDDATLVSGPTAGATITNGVLNWAGTLNLNESATIQYSVRVNPSGGDNRLPNAVVSPNCPPGTLTPPCGGELLETGYTVDKASNPPSGTTVKPGDSVTYTLALRPFGTARYTGATLTDSLADVLDDATLTVAPQASKPGMTFDGTTITWNGDLEIDEEVTIRYTVQVKPVTELLTTNGSLGNSVIGPNCPTPSDVPPCGGRLLVGGYLVSKTGTPSSNPLVPGSTLTYTLTVRQVGAGGVTAATITDDLAAVLDDATVTSQPAPTKGAASISPAGVLTWTSDLVLDDVVAIPYTVTVKPAAQLGDGVMRNAVFGPNCPTPDQPDCFREDFIRAWTVVKSSDPAPGTQISPSSQVAYRLTLTNRGSLPIPDATLTDNMGGVLDDATVTSGPTSGSIDAAGVLNWTGALAVDQVFFIDYTVTLDAYADLGDGTLFNAVVAVEGGCPSPPVTNPAAPGYNANCSTYHYTPLLQYNKTSNAASPVRPGDLVTYTITVTNTGTALVPSVPVTDDLSAVLDDATLVGNPTGPGTLPAINGNVLTWTGPVAPGTPVAITYTVRVKSAAELGTTPNNDGILVNTVDIPRTPCVDGQPECPPNRDPIEAWTYSKTSDPASGAQVTPGDAITYTLTVTNTGGVALNKSIVDDLSDVLDDATLTAGPTASSGSVSPPDVNNVITWTGDLAIRQVVTITYTVTVRPAYQVVNGIIGNQVTTPDGGECFPVPCDTEHHVRSWDVLKEADVVEVTPGGTVNYTITVTNTGSVAITDETWTDDLTGILDDAVVTAEPTTTSGDVDLTGNLITWTGDLALDQVVTIEYSVRVNRPLSGDRSLTNAVFTPDEDGPCNVLNPIPDRCKDNVPGRELTVVKATEPADREFAVPGETVFYTMTITNTGALDYATATVEDGLSAVLDDADGPTPAQITVTGPGAAGFDPNTGILTWTGPIAVDQVAVVRYAVTVHPVVTGDAHLLNVVTSPSPGALCPEPAITDPEAPGFDPNCVTDTAVKAYEIDKTSDPVEGSEVEPGDTVTYTLTLTNTGDVDVNGETVTDDLSGVLDDATLDGDPVASDGDASITDTTLTWTGDLPVDGVVTITYSVTVKPSDEFGDAIIGNLVTGTGPTDCPDPAITDESDPLYNPDCLTESNVKGYTIMKSSEPVAGTEIEPGDDVVYTITIANTGTVDLTELVVTDSLTDVLDDADVTVEPTADAGEVGRVGDVITWSGDLAIDEVVTFTYEVRVKPVLDLGDGDVRNPVVGTGPNQCPNPPVSDPQDPDFDPNCVNILPIKAYTIVKSSNPADGAVVQPFDRITYTLTLTNVGTAPLTDLTVNDSLTDVLDDADLDGAPTASGGTASVAGDVLSWTGGIAVGEIVTVTYVAVVKPPTTLGDSHLGNVVVGTGPTSCPAAVDPDVPAPPAGPNPDCETDHGVAAYTTLKEVVSPAAPKPGEQVTYRITITSVGSVAIVGETISDDLSGVLDDGVWDNTASFTASNPATTGAFSYTASTLSWTGDIAVDDVLVITYSVTLNPQVTGDGWLRNVVSSNDCPFLAAMGSPLAFAATAAMPPNCKTDTAIPSVAFTKSVSPAGPFKPGDVVTYTITATNNGQVNLDGITWTDDMTRVLDDADMNGQPSSDRGAASFSTPIVSWTGSLAVGEVAHITYQVRIKEQRGDGSMPNGVVGVGPGSNCPATGAGVECLTQALVLPAGIDLDPTDPGELPRTGGNTSGIVLIASMLLAAGVGLIALRRRRRSITS